MKAIDKKLSEIIILVTTIHCQRSRTPNMHPQSFASFFLASIPRRGSGAVNGPLGLVRLVCRARSGAFLALFACFCSGQALAQLERSAYGNETLIRDKTSILLKPGFHVPAGKTVRIFTGAGFVLTAPFAGTASTGQNYIRTHTFRAPTTTGSTAGLNINDVNEVIQYFDGLGRPIQTVQTQASPGFADIVQPVAYDALGREDKKYLPYAGQGGNGSFRPTAVADAGGFYNNPPPGVAGTAYPFAQTVFEASPLNRVQQQGSPGLAWQIGQGHEQHVARGSNNSSTAYATTGYAVRLYHAGPETVPGREHGRILSGTGFYGDNELYLTVTKDENWTAADGKEGTMEEYVDKEGRTVLKRAFVRQGTAIAVLSTYYVYDDLGNLSFVLPPGAGADAATVPDQAALDMFCYQYRYDGRKRLIEKKVAGRDWEHMVYNKLDQLVLSQDGKQRAKAQKEWLFNKYDAIGRIIKTGIYASNDSRPDLQDTINNAASLWETRDTGDYPNTAFPTTGTTPLTINYYDDYTYPGALGQPITGGGEADAPGTKTLLTGTKVYSADGTVPLVSSNYYDSRARLVRCLVLK
jgi:hypothetical protein